MAVKALTKMASKTWKNKPGLPAKNTNDLVWCNNAHPTWWYKEDSVWPTSTTAYMAACAATTESYDSTSMPMAAQGGNEDGTQPSVTQVG